MKGITMKAIVKVNYHDVGKGFYSVWHQTDSEVLDHDYFDCWSLAREFGLSFAPESEFVFDEVSQ
jgi:hypothetical protein